MESCILILKNPMPRPFRTNFAPAHMACVLSLARMGNATNSALHYATGIGQADGKYVGRYMTDLVARGFVEKKVFTVSSRDASNRLHGTRGGNLYALTEKGAIFCGKEQGLEPGAIYFPTGGIQAESEFLFLHRKAMLEFFGCLLRLERMAPETFEIEEIIPDFRGQGSNRLGQGGRMVSVLLPESKGVLKPDAILRFQACGKGRLVAIEIHRQTSAKEIIKQLQRHAIAVRLGLFSERFGHPTTNFVLSVHNDASKLKNVLERIRGGKEFPEFFEYGYMNGYHFSTLEEVIEKGVERAFYHLDGVPSQLFPQYTDA